MDPYFFILIAGYILFASSLVAIPLKRKIVMAVTGELLYGFPKKRIGFMIGVEIAAAVLITLSFFIRYTFFVTVILCGCGVLGAWIIVGEAALGKYYGLYENGIIGAGKYIPYDDILGFPVLNLPKNEQLNHPQNVLIFISRKYGNVELSFETDEICNEVITTLRKMHVIK